LSLAFLLFIILKENFIVNLEKPWEEIFFILISELFYSDFPYFILCFLYAVIDIVRMLVLHPDGAILLQKHFEAENGINIAIFLFSDIKL